MLDQKRKNHHLLGSRKNENAHYKQTSNCTFTSSPSLALCALFYLSLLELCIYCKKYDSACFRCTRLKCILTTLIVSPSYFLYLSCVCVIGKFTICVSFSYLCNFWWVIPVLCELHFFGCVTEAIPECVLNFCTKSKKVKYVWFLYYEYLILYNGKTISL